MLMNFNQGKIKKLLHLPLTKLTVLIYFFIAIWITHATSTSAAETSKISDDLNHTERLGNRNTQNEAVIIINGYSPGNYSFNTLKEQGAFLVNLVTSGLKTNSGKTNKLEIGYDSIIVQNEISKILESIKLLFQTKGCSFKDVFTTQQNDVELADFLRESFNKPFNGETFRTLSRNKVTSINQLNKLLQAEIKSQVVTIEEFTNTILEQSLPCSVKVIRGQQTLATYFIGQPSDVGIIFEKINACNPPNVKLWLQPYPENLYRLQINSVNNKATPLALWHEKPCIKEGEVQDGIRALVNLKESSVISQDQLMQLSQKLVEGIHLHHGMVEFILIFHEDQVEVVDYSLTLSNHNYVEVMERVMGYSPLSYYLMHSAFTEVIPLPQKEFKNIVAVNLLLNNKNDLLKLGMLPTFYRFYPAVEEEKEVPIAGELYLVHTNKNLVTASCAAIKNTEQLLLNPMFLSHSASHIVNFYREAVINKNADYTLEKGEKPQLTEALESLKQLYHESQHIPKYVKPMDSKAGIPDIMRYYIDIYDLYILHGKAPGTKITPMNTGNPAFLPFPPIVKSLNKSLKENLISYARYSMQVPGTDFIDKLTRYCQEERILLSSQELQPTNVVIGHGSTNLYYLALKSIIKNKGDIVLITRPTYGLFIDPVYTAGGEIGFIDIKESEEWKVQPQQLQETIHFYNGKAFNNHILTTFIKEYEKLLHALKVFNLRRTSIPPMPDIEGIKNLKVFDKYIETLNAFIDNISDPLVDKDELKFSFSPRVKAFYHMNPHNPTGSVYTKKDLKAIAEVIQAHPDTYVIDDLAHWGVLYEEIEPATFASLEGMFEKTLTLMSLSKSYCVPGLRTGVAIGNKEIISEMQYRLLNSSSSASLPAMIALDAVFGAPKKERDDYLKNNSQEYFFRRNLMKLLINGIQQTNLNLEQKIRIYQLILESEYKEGKPFDKNFLNLILSGMPLVRTLTEPKGCFFHLLDISKLIGARIAENPPFKTSTDVRNAIYSICNIDMVPGEISGNFFNYSLRMSFSLSPEQIYNACKNINLFIGNYIIKYNPSLVEKNYAAIEMKKAQVRDEFTLNKALTRFYLTQVLHSLRVEQDQLLSVNPIQDTPRLQELEEKINELTELTEKISDHSFEKDIHSKIYSYVEKNKEWLQVYLPGFEQLSNCLREFKG